MSDKKNFSFQDIVDIFLNFGGIAIGSLLTLAIFMAHHVPPPAFLMVMGAWLAGGIGGYRLLNRRNKELKEEIQYLTQGQNRQPSSNQLGASSFQREIHQAHAQIGDSVALEVRILDFMAMKKGRITILEAVVYLREPIDKVKPVLEKLQRDGFIRVDVSETGELIYVTDAFITSV